ncbi:hypothetical protein [Dichelobacter nodosus]|uniref:hypothetical protein n=1 Tax=Dichelobacter nodosus TaxID=870 RepID=UPI000E297ECF|nr:hypothetical protein [Dichelobacter nodosus]AXM45959.1 hypothetical protein DYQ38_05685 [Dichelobacter nodosus]
MVKRFHRRFLKIMRGLCFFLMGAVGIAGALSFFIAQQFNSFSSGQTAAMSWHVRAFQRGILQSRAQIDVTIPALSIDTTLTLDLIHAPFLKSQFNWLVARLYNADHSIEQTITLHLLGEICGRGRITTPDAGVLLAQWRSHLLHFPQKLTASALLPAMQWQNGDYDFSINETVITLEKDDQSLRVTTPHVAGKGRAGDHQVLDFVFKNGEGVLFQKAPWLVSAQLTAQRVLLTLPDVSPQTFEGFNGQISFSSGTADDYRLQLYLNAQPSAVPIDAQFHLYPVQLAPIQRFFSQFTVVATADMLPSEKIEKLQTILRNTLFSLILSQDLQADIALKMGEQCAIDGHIQEQIRHVMDLWLSQKNWRAFSGSFFTMRCAQLPQWFAEQPFWHRFLSAQPQYFSIENGEIVRKMYLPAEK